MVLLTLLGVAAGTALVNGAAKKHQQKANPNLNRSKFDADNAQYGVATSSVGYTEQKIMDIAARCGVRPNKHGVLPENGYKHCFDYVSNYINHPSDLDNFERDWREAIAKQLSRKSDKLKSESEEHYEYICKQWYTDGIKEKCERSGKTIVLTIKHWHGMSKDQHLERVDNLVKNTILGDKITKQPIIRNNPRFDNSLVETWVFKALPSDKQDGMLTMNSYKLLYKTCCKHLGYDPML